MGSVTGTGSIGGVLSSTARVAGQVAAAGALAALLAGCGSDGDSGATRAIVGATQTGTVSHVVDGDTLDVEGVGRIRLIGIDAPERGECGYDSATAAISVLVLGREVTLVPGATDDADRYGRLLRYVDRAEGDAGLALIEDGWAIARYDSRDGYGRHPREEAYVAADAVSPDRGCYQDD